MAWEEKYGAIWHVPLRDGESVLSERYLPERDLVALVVKRADNRLSASVLSKGQDPQWRMPFWGDASGPALVESLADAETYFQSHLHGQD